MTASAFLLPSGANHEIKQNLIYWWLFLLREQASSQQPNMASDCVFFPPFGPKSQVAFFFSSCNTQNYRKVDSSNVHIFISNLNQRLVSAPPTLNRVYIGKRLTTPPASSFWAPQPEEKCLGSWVAGGGFGCRRERRPTQPLLPLPRLLPLPPLRYDTSSGEMHPPFPFPLLSPLNCLSVNILPAHFLHSYVEARQKQLKWKKKEDLLVFCAPSLCAEQGQMFVMGGGGHQTSIISLPREDRSLFGTWPRIVPAAPSRKGF